MIKILIPIFTVVLLSGCATAMPGTQVEGAAGFFAGFWHGFIAIYSLIGHLFDPTIVVFETPNNGGWYNFGFILGAGLIGERTITIVLKTRKR